MAIVTEEEIKDFVTGIGSTPLSDQQALLRRAVESFVKAEVGRDFESAARAQFFTIQRAQSVILLGDAPVSALTSVERVTSRSTAGVPTLETIDADGYVSDLDKGRLRNLNGGWPEGIDEVKVTYTAGYTAGNLTANANEEINLLKHLVLSLYAREWGLTKENKAHVRTISFGDESVTYKLEMDRMTRSIVRSLKERRLAGVI